MPKRNIQTIRIKVVMEIRKDYWKAEGLPIDPKIFKERIQSGIEVPIEICEVECEE